MRTPTLINRMLITVFAVPVLAMSAAVAAPVAQVHAAGDDDESTAKCEETNIDITKGAKCAKGTGVKGNLFSGNKSLFKTVTDVLLFLIGAVSVIVLIIGGFRYVLSNGDSNAVAGAKNTILYGVIGIIVALLAYAIVNFVVSSFVAQ